MFALPVKGVLGEGCDRIVVVVIGRKADRRVQAIEDLLDLPVRQPKRRTPTPL